MRSKKLLLSLVLTLATILGLGVTGAYASEYEDNLIKRIAPDGVNATFKAQKPADPMMSEYYLTGIASKMLDEDGYTAYAYCIDGDITDVVIEILDDDGEYSNQYNINVTWEEPAENKALEEFINRLEPCDSSDAETCYQVMDLGLINYYLTSENSELWNSGAPSRALKYSSEIIELSRGGNVSFHLEVGMGDQGDDYMFETAFGEMTLFQNGYAYEGSFQGVHLKRVLYIPQDTEDTTEAYVAAAQKRINDYLGTTDVVTVSYGGSLDDLEEDWYEDATVPRSMTDGNYYNVTVKGKTYRFYIIKGTAEDLVAPSYIGSDFATDITITSSDAEVPLDTALTVNSVESDEIEEALGTDVYEAYDIKLYSDGKNATITKLENGKFLVSIPVGEELSDKEIIVYYLNSEGKLEEYVTTVKDGVASFETDHFSTYILAENTTSTDDKENNDADDNKGESPKTGEYSVFNCVSIISILAVCGAVIFGKRFNR